MPRTCAVRQELAAWGHAQPALPLLGETPGRTPAEAPRRWQGPSVLRPGAVASSEGGLAQEPRRFLVVQSSPLAQQPTPSYAAAQAKASEVVAAHVRQGHARWFACRPDAEAAMAA